VYDDQNLLLSATDSTLRNSRRFTLYCKYTASRVDKFLFSTLHLEGHAFQDTLPPHLISIAQESPRAVRLTFNEACVPAQGALNGLIAYHQGTAIDTALYPELDGRNWTCTFPKPLPRTALAFLLQNTVDTAQNPSGNLWEFLDIDYLPERCMAITAIQPFDQSLPSFLRIQSPTALPQPPLAVPLRHRALLCHYHRFRPHHPPPRPAHRRRYLDRTRANPTGPPHL
jgi:hypothetical protein